MKRLIGYLLMLNSLFAASLYLLRYNWYVHDSEGALSILYPNFYVVIDFFEENSTVFFLVLCSLFLLMNGGLVFNWLIKHKGKNTSLFLLGSLFFSIVIAEICLRIFGFTPGQYTYSQWFSPVDTLWEYKGFSADENGIMKIDALAAEAIAQRIKSNKNKVLEFESHEVYSLIRDYTAFLNAEVSNDLFKYYNKLLEKGERTELEEAVLTFCQNPINEEGFRSIPFRNYPNDKPSILLLGDSFTWGHSTENKTSAFADILLAKGYTVFNTGITATDVAQYLAIAKKYVPELRPDIVVVNFYLGNDISYYKRNTKPFKKVFYPTNAGNIMDCPKGRYFEDINEAYEITLERFVIPDNECVINKICSKTVFTTLVWKALNISQLTPYIHFHTKRFDDLNSDRDNLFKYGLPYSNIKLAKIKEISEKHGAHFILSSIPEVYTYTFKTVKDFPDLFGGLEYVEMEADKTLYKLDDGHFNDKGHQAYADFLIKHVEGE